MSGADLAFICMNIWYARWSMKVEVADTFPRWVPAFGFYFFMIAFFACKAAGV